ncbi:alpha-tocopherol transfer protein-like isoform X2 [Topomyia yanbarensis]|uniref:alpha-tocopherol transfer protein-like isoform X2 n=1 Tax=Topomyia yanbarensis TaxID=2498891 RepID=UPI00273BD3E9|nr:alpha-tocopherol transfer protein-like isoform X2 [Topomyia yanbarensis]
MFFLIANDLWNMENLDNSGYNSVNTLMEWLKSQPHLPHISENDALMFLHCNYYDTEAAKQTIEKYYTFRTNCSDFFKNRDVEDPAIHTALNLTMFTVFPKSTPEGYKIAYCRLIDTDTTNYVHLYNVKYLILCLDLWMKEEAFAPGHVIIVDMEGMNLGHVAKMKISVLRNYVYYTQEALPIRLKQLHFLNVVPFMDKVMFLVKPFLQKKVVDVMHMHTNLQTMLKAIPVECLPEEYGGNAGKIKDLREAYNQKLFKRRLEFLTEETLAVVDNNKRIPAPRRFMFGLFGR